MPPDTEIVFNKCGVSDFFHRKHCDGFLQKILNYQGEAISVLWYIHIILRILTKWCIYVRSCLEPLQRARHSCHSLLLQEAGQLQGLKTSQANPLSHISQHCTPQSTKKYSRGFLYFNFYWVNLFHAWKKHLYWLGNALETLKLSLQPCISNNKLL